MPNKEQATDNLDCPTYVAMVADDYLESDHSLAALLDLLRQLHDPADGEDICIWKQDRTIAAVFRADGTVHVFEQQPAPAPPAPKPARKGKPP